MYKLNDEEITKESADKLISDLAMFPYNESDLALSLDERKEKYKEELLTSGTLQIAEQLIITV